MMIRGQNSSRKNFQMSVLIASALAIGVGSLIVEAAPVSHVRQGAHRPVQLMRQAPVTDSASGREYSARLWNRILNLWDYPNGNNHVTIVATVSADGNVEATQVTSSPKCAEAEAAAQTAFEKAKPLEALPKGMTSAKVTMLFNSKADPHGDSSSGGSVRLDGIHSTRAISPAAESETESQPEPPARTEAKTEIKSETKPEVKSGVKPAPKSEVKAPVSETKIESKTETKTESKVETTPEAKPEPKSKSGAVDEFGSH